MDDKKVVEFVDKKIKALVNLVDGGMDEISKHAGKYAAIYDGKIIASNEYLNRLQQDWKVRAKRNSDVNYLQDLIPCTTILPDVKKTDCVETFIPNF